MLNFAKKINCKNFLFLSSGAAYGNRERNIKFKESLSSAPYTNDINFDVSVLGEAKRSAETLLTIFSKQNKCKTNVARCFSFIGPFMPLDIHYAAGNFLKDAILKKKIKIIGNPNTVRSYMYFSDLTVCLWRILLIGNNREIYNVGSDKQLTILKLAKLIKSIVPNVKKIEIIKNVSKKKNILRSFYQ